MMLNAVAVARSPYERFGTFSSPRNNPGFQTKKNSVGKRTAAPPNSEIAGMAVNMGIGETTEGAPAKSNPIEAGINKLNPRINVTRRFS